MFYCLADPFRVHFLGNFPVTITGIDRIVRFDQYGCGGCHNVCKLKHFFTCCFVGVFAAAAVVCSSLFICCVFFWPFFFIMYLDEYFLFGENQLQSFEGMYRRCHTTRKPVFFSSPNARTITRGRGSVVFAPYFSRLCIISIISIIHKHDVCLSCSCL